MNDLTQRSMGNKALKPRRIHLADHAPIEILYKGQVVLRVMGKLDAYKEPMILIDLASRDAGYDWSPAASFEIRTTGGLPQ
jgi:hypothetical protein